VLRLEVVAPARRCVQHQSVRHPRLADRILERKNDLEDALADLPLHDVAQRQAIETALATLYPLLTGNLAHPPDVVARRLSRWLERNKHLARTPGLA
jgi:hypothetical protein